VPSFNKCALGENFLMTSKVGARHSYHFASIFYHHHYRSLNCLKFGYMGLTDLKFATNVILSRFDASVKGEGNLAQHTRPQTR